MGDVEADAEKWDSHNAYLKDPEVGQLLRCSGFLTSAATLYFAYGMGELTDLTQQTGATPRMPPADIEERNAYILAARKLVKKAEMPAQSLSDYGVWGSSSGKSGEKKSYSLDDFKDSSRSAVRQAEPLIRGGVGFQAMNVDGARCFDLPEIAPLEGRLQARLGKAVPGTEEPASPRIARGRLPQPLHAYLYKPEAYRYLTCASIPYVMGTERFGMMPNPGDPFAAGTNVILNLAQANLEPAQAAEREAHREASLDTFEAGLKRMGIKSEAEKASYQYSFRVAVDAVTPLVKEGLADDLMAEPVLQCAALPTMAPFVAAKGNPSAAAAVSLEKPEGFRSWPDRKTGYLANSTAFRNIFCSAMIYAAYTNGAAEDVWFAPPSRRDEFWSSGDGDAPEHDEDAAERAAAKALIYKLYDAGQIDKEAKEGGKWFFSKYAKDYTLATYAANRILKDRQGVEAMRHDTAQCFALPGVAPMVETIEAKVSAWDER